MTNQIFVYLPYIGINIYITIIIVSYDKKSLTFRISTITGI